MPAEWLQVQKAREAGYSDQEIVDTIAEKEGLSDRIKVARDRGFSNASILEGMAKKIGMAEAAGMGAVDAATFNLTDEVVGAGSYLSEMKRQGNEVQFNKPARMAAEPLAAAASPLTGFFGMPFGGAKKPAKKTDRKLAMAIASKRAEEEMATVRHTQDRARSEEPGAYFGGTVAGALATIPVGGPVTRGFGAAARAVPGAAKVAEAGSAVSRAAGNVAARAVPTGVRTVAGNVARVVPSAARRAIGDVVTTVGKGAGYGAGYGALAGFGDARGGVDERFAGAMTGAGTGAMFGSVLAPVARYGIGGASAFAREKFGRSDSGKAMSMIIRRARQEGVDLPGMVDDFYVGPKDNVARTRTKVKASEATALDHVDEIDEAQAWLDRFNTGESKPARLRPRASSDTLDETVGELMGQGTKDLQVALSNRPGPGKKIAAEAFIERGQKTGQRVKKSFDDALKAEGEDFYDEAARLKDKRMSDPKEPYKEAYARKIEDEEYYHIVQLFRARKRFRKALPEAAQYAEDMGRSSIKREIVKFAKALEDEKAEAANGAHMTETRWNKLPKLSVEALDYVERMVSGGIDYLAGKNPTQAMGVTAARDAFRKLLPAELNNARSVSAKGFDVERALQEGRQAFNSGVDLEEIVARLKDADPEVKGSYIQGVARGIYDLFARQRDLGGLADAASKVQGNELARSKLMELLPKSKTGKPTAGAQRLLDRLDREAEMAQQAKASMGGSQTAARQAAIEAAEEGDTLDNIASLIAERLTGQGGSAAEKAGAYVVDKFKRPGIRNPGINRELANRLFASGRDNVLATLKELRDYERKVAPKMLSEIPERVGVAVGARKAGQEAAAADPYANDAPAAQSKDVVDAVTAPAIVTILDPSVEEDERQAAQVKLEATLDTPERWDRYVKLLAVYGLEPVTDGPGRRSAQGPQPSRP